MKIMRRTTSLTSMIILKIMRISIFDLNQEVIPLDAYALRKSTIVPKIIRVMPSWERSLRT